MMFSADFIFKISITLIVIISNLCVEGTNKNGQKERNVLIFGGNGFIGSETVELLINSGVNVVMVNRGSLYWDAGDRIFPLVPSITCDREEGFKECSELMNLLRNKSTAFDAVVDFSGYTPTQVTEALEIVKEKTALYIFISTDSVYDVCDIMHGNDMACKETDSICPYNTNASNKAISHEYGQNKLEAEDKLVEQRKKAGGVPYTILRFPDVIGPRDVTYRWWIYQLWTKVQSKIPGMDVTVPEYMAKFNISFVYSLDIAKLIVKLVKKEVEGKDEIFNIAWPQSFTLKQVLLDISKELNQERKLEIVPSSDARSKFFMYPSARYGAVDVSKATKMLNWEPTPWQKALKDTVAFYEKVMTENQFQIEITEVINILEDRLPENIDKSKLQEILETLYNISLDYMHAYHDEL